MVILTEEELEIERRYRRLERLGLLCEDAQPTPEQFRIAEKEADEVVADLRSQTTSS